MAKPSSNPPIHPRTGRYSTRPYEKSIIDGEYMKRLRKKLGLTQMSVATQLGCSVGTVHKWEAGETLPSPAYRMQIRELCKRWRVSWQNI